MKPFPTDDATLLAVQHALGGSYTVDEGGRHALVGASYSLSELLEFLSGYDEKNRVQIGVAGTIPIYEQLAPMYTERDVIGALVEELLTCRSSS